eukprot:5150052-Amphidinium_carterae.1
MRWNALRGFEALSLTQLGMLVKELGIAIADKKVLKQETEVVTRLVRHVLGDDVSEVTLARALSRRHLVEVPAEAVPVNTVDESATAQIEGEEVESENELGDNAYIRSAWQSIRESKEANAQKRFQTLEEFQAKWKAWLSRHVPAVNAEAMGVAPVVSSEVSRAKTAKGSSTRVYNPATFTGMTPAEASKYLPEGYKLTVSQRESRWKLSGGSLTGIKSKSYGKGSDTDSTEAMLYLLAMAWQVHRKKTGEACPYTLESLRGQSASSSSKVAASTSRGILPT